jgi:L-methionine (R)-S-oxide reductase
MRARYAQRMEQGLEGWLRAFIAKHRGIAGTVHVLKDDALALAAAVNIPPKVQEITRTIPKGKGMAGLAWERMQPVSTCNLKTDQTGDVRPGAKAVDAQAAVALPIIANGALWGVVGIAFTDERVIEDAELAALTKEAGEATRA